MLLRFDPERLNRRGHLVQPEAKPFDKLFIVRTSLGDATLTEEFPGYREYATRTTRRLLPFVCQVAVEVGREVEGLRRHKLAKMQCPLRL